jgi:hypothetical protein
MSHASLWSLLLMTDLSVFISSGRCSGGELSSDSGRRSGTHSPPASIPYAATVPRSHRFNPLATSSTRGSVRSHRRKPSRSNDDSDEEDDEFQPHAPAAGSADS